MDVGQGRHHGSVTHADHAAQVAHVASADNALSVNGSLSSWHAAEHSDHNGHHMQLIHHLAWNGVFRHSDPKCVNDDRRSTGCYS